MSLKNYGEGKMIGQIVKANEKSNKVYTMTNAENGFIGEVVKDDCFYTIKEIRCKCGKGEGYIWRDLFKDCFDPVNAKSELEIHITVDGLKTIAVLKENGELSKRAEAKCNPEDRFDFKTGAELAFKRLFGEEPKKEPEIGDSVTVVDGEKSFPTYLYWFKTNAPELLPRFCYATHPQNGTIAEIVKIAPHEVTGTTLYAIEDWRGRIYLIRGDGIEKN